MYKAEFEELNYGLWGKRNIKRILKERNKDKWKL